MAKKIYVGNLSFSAQEDEVYDLFTPFGDVLSIQMINDRDTGRFRGFCFVEMADSDAEAAIEALDGHDFDGRALRVNEARPREGGASRRPSRSGGQSDGGFGSRRTSDDNEENGGW